MEKNTRGTNIIFNDLINNCPSKLHNSNKKVITTCVFRVEKYPNYEDCDIRFDDAVYLGVVDLWISNSSY